MTRREEREHSFIVIFEKMLNNLEIDEIIDSAKETLGWEDSEFVVKTANGVFSNLESIDELIVPKLKKGWTINRLSKVTLALLRLAIYELKFNDDIPQKVAVNEAIELCKAYAGEEDASFLNGVLGAVIRES